MMGPIAFMLLVNAAALLVVVGVVCFLIWFASRMRR